MIFNKWNVPSEFYFRVILEFIIISDYILPIKVVKKFKCEWDRILDESGFPEFLTIHQSISNFTCAYSLGKMVSLKRKRTKFRRCSTTFVDFIEAKWFHLFVYCGLPEVSFKLPSPCITLAFL